MIHNATPGLHDKLRLFSCCNCCQSKTEYCDSKVFGIASPRGSSLLLRSGFNYTPSLWPMHPPEFLVRGATRGCAVRLLRDDNHASHFHSTSPTWILTHSPSQEQLWLSYSTLMDVIGCICLCNRSEIKNRTSQIEIPFLRFDVPRQKFHYS